MGRDLLCLCKQSRGIFPASVDSGGTGGSFACPVFLRVVRKFRQIFFRGIDLRVERIVLNGKPGDGRFGLPLRFEKRLLFLPELHPQSNVMVKPRLFGRRPGSRERIGRVMSCFLVFLSQSLNPVGQVAAGANQVFLCVIDLRLLVEVDICFCLHQIDFEPFLFCVRGFRDFF